VPILAILAVQSGHSGVVHPRTIGVWLVRRALRKRFMKTRPRDIRPPDKD
jgi:hypothetical protein